MHHQGFSVPKSLLDCAKAIHDKFLYGENFVMLSGDSGSGRTSLCEQVVNELESKLLPVFIPCQDEMTQEQLRQLFLQQIAPNEKWDDTEPLYQSFSKLSIPVRQRFLVIVDDADSAISSFFDELISLYEHNLGKNRFSFLVTGHPLWVQTKIAEKNNDKISITEINIPAITIDEAGALCEQMFVFARLDKVYKAILPKLPHALASCEGNISRVIKLTETLMNDPIQVNDDKSSQPQVSLDVKPNAKNSKKKHSSAAIFISIICIVIVLACLVPVFLGSNIVDSIFGKASEQKPDNVQLVDKVQKSAQQGADVNSSTTADDPLSVSAGAVSDINAKGPKGDEANAVHDDGGLLPDVNGGIEAETNNAQPKKSVTLDGNALDEIEKKEADDKSGNPRQGLAGSVKTDANKASDAAVGDERSSGTHSSTNEETNSKVESNSKEVETLSREDNVLFKDQIAKEDADNQKALEAQKKALEQKALQEAELKKKADALALKDNPQKEEKSDNKEKKETAKADTKKASATKNTAKRSSPRARPRSTPVPGSHDELLNKNPRHYTLQVLAGRNKAPLLQAADYVEGRYWIYTTVRNGAPWHVLVMGDFLTAKEAVSRAAILPGSLRAHGSFAKSFEKVQSEMRMQ